VIHTQGELNLTVDKVLWVAAGDGPRVVAEAEDLDDDADRLVACWNACAGLTPEQVAALPRLVAWFRWKFDESSTHRGWNTEWAELERIFLSK